MTGGGRRKCRIGALAGSLLVLVAAGAIGGWTVARATAAADPGCHWSGRDSQRIASVPLGGLVDHQDLGALEPACDPSDGRLVAEVEVPPSGNLTAQAATRAGPLGWRVHDVTQGADGSYACLSSAEPDWSDISVYVRSSGTLSVWIAPDRQPC